MSGEELSHLLESIEKKNTKDVRASLNLLQLIRCSYQDLKDIDSTMAERRLRKLVTQPLKVLFTREVEDFRKLCRELIQRWGMQRKKLQEQEDIKAKKQSHLSLLMKQAESLLKVPT